MTKNYSIDILFMRYTKEYSHNKVFLNMYESKGINFMSQEVCIDRVIVNKRLVFPINLGFLS